MDLRTRVLLSMQRALLGEVSSVMRGITCEWNEKKIAILCVIDGPVQEDDEESVRCIETEVMADFSDLTITAQCMRLDAPKPLASLTLSGGWVFRRRE